MYLHRLLGASVSTQISYHDKITLPKPARIPPSINEMLVNYNPLQPEINQITPNSIPPKVIVIEKKIEPKSSNLKKTFLFQWT